MSGSCWAAHLFKFAFSYFHDRIFSGYISSLFLLLQISVTWWCFPRLCRSLEAFPFVLALNFQIFFSLSLWSHYNIFAQWVFIYLPYWKLISLFRSIRYLSSFFLQFLNFTKWFYVVWILTCQFSILYVSIMHDKGIILVFSFPVVFCFAAWTICMCTLFFFH